MMDVAKLKEILRTEYGIGSEKDFEDAVSKMPGIDIGIFTVPISGRRENDKKEATAVSA